MVSMICGVASRACLATACACIRALVAILSVVCSAGPYGSLPWMDHCFGHHICSLLAQLSFVDHCFDCLFWQFSVQPFPTLVGGCLQGWFLLTGLPWNLPVVPGIFVGPPPTFDVTSSQANHLAMSFKRKQNWHHSHWTNRVALLLWFLFSWKLEEMAKQTLV